jgi:hypothetical protein
MLSNDETKMWMDPFLTDAFDAGPKSLANFEKVIME